ncbi:MAG: phosphopantothenoylcysteine decarboxylase [Candidatus Omnitrophica bacterium]|nr:phosphopantothenoylcysteine decarboxylase [Candidatus Omnitrophota bacterium]
MHLLISAGPTREPIDPVRFLSNESTGYMGSRLAAEALARGHRVTVVLGPGPEPMPSGARLVAVRDARGMEAAMRRLAAGADAVIMAAAVSDFRPARARIAKLRRRARLTLRLVATPDIIARLPRRAGRQVRVGFALEGGAVVPQAARKLRAKRLDLLVAQRVNGAGSPFGRRPVHAWLLTRRPGAAAPAVQPLGTVAKAQIARVLLDKVEELWYGQHRMRKAGHVAKT